LNQGMPEDGEDRYTLLSTVLLCWVHDQR